MEKFCCLCQSCPDCCCGPYSGFSETLQSVDGRMFNEIILTNQDVDLLVNHGFENFINKGEDGFSRLKTYSDGTCTALNNGKCSINQCKPTICKAFPLYIDAFIGVCAIKECKSVKPNTDLAFYNEQLRALLDMYQFWIDYYQTKLE